MAKLNYMVETNLGLWLKFDQNSAKQILKLLQPDRKHNKNKHRRRM